MIIMSSIHDGNDFSDSSYDDFNQERYDENASNSEIVPTRYLKQPL